MDENNKFEISPSDEELLEDLPELTEELEEEPSLRSILAEFKMADYLRPRKREPLRPVESSLDPDPTLQASVREEEAPQPAAALDAPQAPETPEAAESEENTPMEPFPQLGELPKAEPERERQEPETDMAEAELWEEPEAPLQESVTQDTVAMPTAPTGETRRAPVETTMEDTVRLGQLSDLDLEEPEPQEVALDPEVDSIFVETARSETVPQPQQAERRKPERPTEPEPETEPVPREEVTEEYTDREAEDVRYARKETVPLEEPEEEAEPQNPVERVLAPLSTLVAAVALRREAYLRKRAARPRPMKPELPPDKAAKQCSAKLTGLKLRAMAATVSFLILLVLTWLYTGGVDLAGGLYRMPVASLMCLLLLLHIMFAGVDIFTEGIAALCKGRPGVESLVSVSCVCACLDAIYLAVTGVDTVGLPFCAVAGGAMCAAMWARRLRYRSLRAGYSAVAKSKTPYVAGICPDVDDDGSAIRKQSRDTRGFVTRCEQADLPERTFQTVGPFLMAAAVILSIMITAIKKTPFLHNLGALMTAAAGFSMLLCYVTPFALLTRRLLPRGVAIAGFAGAEEISKNYRLIITDTDLFPAGYVSIGGIQLMEGIHTMQAVRYTGSLMVNAENGLSPLFRDLMRRHGCTQLPVDDFAYYDGGGLQGMIQGERVLVGTAGFMHLMGVRLPDTLQVQDAVYMAVGYKLQAVFPMDYRPANSVRGGLSKLLHSRLVPLFAVRDFNITPLLLQKRFRVDTGKLVFPAFPDRHRISEMELPDHAEPAAVLTREGLGPMVDAARGGRRLYRVTQLGTIFSVACSIVAMVIMSFLCFSGAYDAASAGNLLTYMLLWLVPVFVLSWSVNR